MIIKDADQSALMRRMVSAILLAHCLNRFSIDVEEYVIKAWSLALDRPQNLNGLHDG